MKLYQKVWLVILPFLLWDAGHGNLLAFTQVGFVLGLTWYMFTAEDKAK